MFLPDREALRKPNPEDPKKIVNYNPHADYYEARVDFIVSRKFPKTAKILGKII